MSRSGKCATGLPGGWSLALMLALTLPGPAALALDCSAPTGTIDFATGPLQEVAGIVSGPDSAELYSCSPTLHPGQQDVWEVLLPADGQVTVQVVSAAPGVTAFLTSACDEAACETAAIEGAAGCARQLTAGTCWLVVEDGMAAVGDYELRLVYEEEFARWDVCQLPAGGTGVGDRVSDRWSFDDQATCVGHSQSLNFPDGCPFVMYVTVDCGTSLHLPLLDTESIDLQVFDVFRGEYMELTARSRSWNLSGTRVQWEDSDCPGSDPNPPDFNVDVDFSASPLCGLFRIEFGPFHAGWLWELLANCDGSLGPLFPIADSACAALDGYRPLPELSIINVVEAPDCLDYSVTYEVTNQGCAPSGPFEVHLRDGGSLIGTNIHPSLSPGEAAPAQFVPAGPTMEFLFLELDPGDQVEECSESLGVACRVDVGEHFVSLVGCPETCEVSAQAQSPPARCDDDGEALLVSACASPWMGCPGGVLEYALVELGSGEPPVFSLDCNLVAEAPDQTTDYAVIARCQADPDCSDLLSIRVEVLPGPCELDCTDGLDEDGDGLVDCSDADCCASPDCDGAPELDCCDRIDNDCDGQLDEEDSDCDGMPLCPEWRCSDGLDNDLDGDIDCDDPDCLCDAFACPALDCDGDGVENGADCAPGDATAWSVPGAVELRVAWLAPAEVLLTWSDTLPPAGTTGGYDVAFDDLALLALDREARAPCQVRDLLIPSRVVPAPPATALYFLVRARNACGPLADLGWGAASSGFIRPVDCP